VAIIFLWKGEYFALAIYPTIKLSRCYLLTENISVRLQSNFFCPRFRLLSQGWCVWQLLPSLELLRY